MINDLCVSKIVNVYQNDTSCWRRSEPRARNRHGLVLFTRGEIEYYFPDQTILATAGTVMLFPSNIPYYGVARTKRVAYCVLDFQALSDSEVCRLGAPCIARVEGVDALHREFLSIISIWEQQRMDAAIRIKAFLYATLAQVMPNEESETAGQVRSSAVRYIFDHYTDPDISVSSLCKMFYISESQLRRNVLKLTGITTNEYITSLRLNRAKRELICTQKSIKQIAYESGFSSAYYFSRCFHQYEKLSPKEYRRENLML